MAGVERDDSPRPRTGALFVAGLAVAFLAVRWPLYLEPGIRLGWNSDAALYGLMARAMLETNRPIFLFWGGDYLGTLTSMWAVLAALPIGTAGPLALRVGVAAQLLVSLVLFWLGLRKIYGWPAASLAIAWLGAGPYFFFKLSYAPVSAEQMFFVGSIAFWYAVRAPFTRPVQWLVLGAVSGVGWWAHRGALLVVLPVVVVVATYDGWFRPVRRLATAAACSTCGFVIGLLPQFLGRYEIDQRLYTPITPAWSLRHVLEQLGATLHTDLWRFLGMDTTVLPPWLGGACVLALVALGIRALPLTRGHVMALAVVSTVFGFWLLSPMAYAGAVRYLIAALPIVYALAARGIVRLGGAGRIGATVAVVVALAMAAALYVPRHHDALAVAEGRREQHEKWPGGFDPRPVLAQLDREQYPVCYADFWLAYKLEWLSDSGVQFIPYRSVNSTQVRSIRLSSAPGRKCFVALDGTVRTLTRSEEAALRADTIDLVRGRPGLLGSGASVQR
jgi:hypothetical protein